jgi:hypothetical protein
MCAASGGGSTTARGTGTGAGGTVAGSTGAEGTGTGAGGTVAGSTGAEGTGTGAGGGSTLKAQAYLL